MPRGKWQEERAEIRGQAEAKRRSGKDRSSHDAKRGEKVPTLQSLSGQMPTEAEILGFIGITLKESDRGAAIMAAALVEMSLEMAIRAKLVDPGQEITKSWFSGTNAPFGTFSAKIKLGRALAIYANEMDSRLGAIKDIRNTFAHRNLPLDLENEAAIEACNKMAPFMKRATFKDNYRMVFVTGCVTHAHSLLKFAMKHGGKTMIPDFL